MSKKNIPHYPPLFAFHLPGKIAYLNLVFMDFERRFSERNWSKIYEYLQGFFAR